MKKWVVVLVLFIFAVPAFAEVQEVIDQDVLAKEKKIEELTVEYGLSADQQNSIRTSREKYKSQIEEKEKAFKEAQEKFSTAINNPNTTTTELQALFMQKMNASNELYQVHFQSRMEFRDILLPEQRAKMISKYENVKQKNLQTQNAKNQKKSGR